jgi:hypothetical protein
MLALQLVAVAAAVAAAAPPSTPTHQCGNSTSFCPATMPCCLQKYSPSKYGCEVPLGNNAVASAGCGDGLGPTTATTWCCKMGPGEPPSKTLPNVLVIGDSVSIGYVGGVAKILKASKTALVQHGPWDVSDGGAGDTAMGITCLDRWLVTQAQLPVKWDLITFNFGLHDLSNSTHCEELYRAQLKNITSRLVASGSKLLWVATTPFMPLRRKGNTVVEDMNAIAAEVIKPHNIPIVDLYTVVTNVCGPVYTNCSICRVEPCSYHYNA